MILGVTYLAWIQALLTWCYFQLTKMTSVSISVARALIIYTFCTLKAISCLAAHCYLLAIRSRKSLTTFTEKSTVHVRISLAHTVIQTITNGVTWSFPFTETSHKATITRWVLVTPAKTRVRLPVQLTSAIVLASEVFIALLFIFTDWASIPVSAKTTFI